MSRLHCAGKWKAVCGCRHELNVIILTYWIHVISFRRLIFELSLLVRWQISRNDAGCEFRAWIKGMWQTCSMHLLFVSTLTLLIRIPVCHRLSVSDQFQRANSKGMQIRASGSADLVQALGFKWIIYNTEFASRRAADCHLRHPASWHCVCRP